MIVYPAIDLIGGKCVRLAQGDFNCLTEYEIDPIVVAEAYRAAGASWIHVVDLEGAKASQCRQISLIAAIVAVSEKVQMGGGVRTKEDIKTLLALGVKRVVIGSLCVLQPQQVTDWLDEFGAEKFALALDFKMNADNQPIVATRGWQDSSHLTLWTVLDTFKNARSILCTDISRDGMGMGTNVAVYSQIKNRYPKIELIASGGVGCLGDIRQLSKIGVPGIIVGKALYENKFSLAEALSC